MLLAMPWRICLGGWSTGWIWRRGRGKVHLPDGTKLAEEVEKVFGGDVVVQILDEECATAASV